MKILVTGSQGQVGQAICEKSPNVIACDKFSLNITDINSIKDNIDKYKPDIIINCAAYTAVDKAESEKEKTFLVNSTGPENLAKVCSEKNIFLMHLSTDYIFDGAKTSAYIETDRTNPQSVYGESKWQGEELIRKYCKDYLILRVSWVFGKHGNNFVKTILRLSKERDELKIVADQHGCPTYAGDIADVLLDIAQKPIVGTYHYCGQPETTWYGFAKEIAKNTKIIPITTAEYPTPAKRPQNSVLNCELFQKTFNLELKPWQIGLEKMLNG